MTDLTALLNPPARRGRKPAEQPEVLKDTDRKRGVMKSARSLLAKTFPAPEWAIENLVRRGKSYLLIGPPKEGKSYLALSFAVAVALGGKAFGSLDVTQGLAGYLCLEDGEEELQERLRQLAGRDIDDVAGLSYSDEWPRVDEGGIEDLTEWLRKNTGRVVDQDGQDVAMPGPVLMVVDILQQIRPSAAGNGKSVYQLDYEALAPLTKLAHDTNCAIVVIHHTRKGNADDWMELISGSNALAGAVDGVMHLRVQDGKGEPGQFGRLQVRGRGQPRAEYDLERDENTGGWAVMQSKAGLSRERRELLEVLVGGGKWKPVDVAQATGKKLDAVGQLLWQCAKAGLVRREERGYYELTAEGHQALATNNDDLKIRNKEIRNGAHPVSDVGQKPYSLFPYSPDRASAPMTESEQIRRQIRARNVIRIYHDHGVDLSLNDDGRVHAYGIGKVPDDLEIEAAELNEEIEAELRERGTK